MSLSFQTSGFSYVHRDSAPLENPTRTEEFHRANGCCHGWMVWVHKVR